MALLLLVAPRPAEPEGPPGACRVDCVAARRECLTTWRAWGTRALADCRRAVDARPCRHAVRAAFRAERAACRALGRDCTSLCGSPCGGIVGIGCPAGAFCELAFGRCCCDVPGVCVPRAVACTKEYLPVCGCDGVTYGNDCARRAAGVARAHAGTCEGIPGP